MKTSSHGTSRTAWTRTFYLGMIGLMVILLGVGAAQAQDAYVATTGVASVAVIDTATQTTTATVAGTGWRTLTFSPDGQFVYSMNFDGFSAIDTSTNTIVASVATGFLTLGIAVTPDGTTGYVGNNGSGTVSVVDLTTYTVTTDLSLGSISSLAITPDGAHVWIGQGSVSGASIALLDTTTNTIATSFATGHGINGPFAMTFTSDGAFAYLANSDGTVSVVDTATLTEVANVSVGAFPFAIALTPDEAFAYVANLTSNSVSVIDTATYTVAATVPVGEFPRGVAITPDGDFAWVTNFNSNSISVIDTATQTVVSTIAVGSRPWGIAFTPEVDSDGDGVSDDVDNCPMTPNADQFDFDGDGAGDACDADVDGDGVDNGMDICPFTDLGELVDPGTGCSIAQLCPCDGPSGTAQPWKNHGQYVSCVSKISKSFAKDGLISNQERSDVVSAAAQSTCGK